MPTVVQLRKKASQLKIRGRSQMTKAELITAIQKKKPTGPYPKIIRKQKRRKSLVKWCKPLKRPKLISN